MIEIERYELAGVLDSLPQLSRREFAGFLFLVTGAVAWGQRGESGGGRRGSLPQDIGAWLHIGEDGKVTAYTGKTEVGQNVRTSLTQAVADELQISPDAIQMVMADTAHVPFDAGTFGSLSTPAMSPMLRRAAAAARENLIASAADLWKADAATLKCKDGRVFGPDGKAASFAELTKGKKLVQSIASETAIKTGDAWTVAGQSLKKVNGTDLVTGKHQYASDMRPTGLVYGKVLRSGTTGAQLVKADTQAAEQIAGAKVIRDGEFIGVTAASTPAAAKAVQAITAEWTPAEPLQGADVYEHFKKTAKEPRSLYKAGDAGANLASSEVRCEQSYRVAYIAHAPMEPRAAVASWEGDRLTVWTGTQRPFGVRDELAQAFGIAPENIRVIVPDTGSAYGGKHTGECAIEAARLAKHSGKPVKLVWSREEEFRYAYLRPAGLIEIAAGATKDGQLTSWSFRNYNSGTSAIRSPYDIAHQNVEFCECQSPMRQGSYRGLAATANTFARESAMDELAVSLGMDPLEFRLKNLKEPRLRAVLEQAAAKFGWMKPASGDLRRGIGIACGTEKGSFVATCAQVEVIQNVPRVVRATTAFECGPVVNPDHLRHQVDGAVVQGIGGALFEAIHFSEGKIENAKFAAYRLPRFVDVPVIETVLVNRKDLKPVGAGETPIIAIAPAIANAIFFATRKRLRSMPLAPDASSLTSLPPAKEPEGGKKGD